MSWLLEKLLRLKPGEWAGADRVLPSLNANYSNWVILGMAVAFMALVALTIRSYLREGNTSRPAKLTIAAVRIIVIALIFALLCQPGVVLRYKKVIHSTVVVVIDDSLSMSLKDRYADGQVRRALTRILGIDEDQLAETTRSEVARMVLSRQGGALSELIRDRKLVLMRFAATEGAYTQRLVELDVPADEAARTEAVMQIQREMMAELSAGGYQTDLARALRQAADRVQGRRVVAVLIVSDGQDTGEGVDGSGPLRGALA
ncbi:hypothetical protein LCGC14_2672490, partial [marine sediment metagenome]